MNCFFISYAVTVATVCAISWRDGILTATYDEVIGLRKQDFPYLSKPMVVTDSPQSQWSLLNHLHEIFPTDYTIKSEQQTTNCSCLAEIGALGKISMDMSSHYSDDMQRLCHHLASALLYKRENNHYKYWQAWEGQHKLSHEMEQCISIEMVDINVASGLTDLYEAHSNSNDSVHAEECMVEHVDRSSRYEQGEDDDLISKKRTYFNAFAFRGRSTEIDAIQLNLLDHIHLHPFFDIFDMHGYSDVNKLHIWFANDAYRAIRHYDKSNNIFFVLKGSRKFRLSKPTINVFEMYPYNHASNRHTYPNYPLFENETMLQKYTIHEVNLYESEVLYLPAYWYHEVLNDNNTIALSIWWDSHDSLVGDDLLETKLPINPVHPDDVGNKNIDKYSIHKHGIDGFFYFLQSVINEWCAYVSQHPEKHEYSMRCERFVVHGYRSFLLHNFDSIWKSVFDQLSFDTFEWFALAFDVDGIIKCTKDRVLDYDDVSDLKQHLYMCHDFEQKYKDMWDDAVWDIMYVVQQHSNIGAAECNLVQLIEDILLLVAGDSNIIPIWIKLMGF